LSVARKLRITAVCEKTSVFTSSKYKNLIGIFPRKIVHLKMQHITGISRQQLQISSLEDKITTDNPIRFIEAFVEIISLESVGFTIQTIKSEGRPSPACWQAGTI